MKKAKSRNSFKSLSLYPLKPEEALSAFMQVDPSKVRLKNRKIQRKKAKK
jgi:hypothetical protein